LNVLNGHNAIKSLFQLNLSASLTYYISLLCFFQHFVQQIYGNKSNRIKVYNTFDSTTICT